VTPAERRPAWRPVAATWEVTRACDGGCVHPCPARELGASEALALVAQLVELRPRLVMLRGDDLLARPGLDDLIAAAVGGGLAVGVAPRPASSLDARRLRRLAGLGVARVALALDGPDAATHDARCGAGRFRRLCAGSRARAFAVTGGFLAADPACACGPAAAGR
jgi:MoaA/NifB/PqqE/SkfB family radical SAM enzyme